MECIVKVEIVKQFGVLLYKKCIQILKIFRIWMYL